MDIEILKARAAIVGAIRRFFDDRGFVEVETAVRIPAPAPEEHIDCPVVSAADGTTYLRASPELQMKKLLAAGLERIYQIGPCFREGERGSRHNPEFTMLEWYRKGATYLDIKEDMERLTAVLGLVEGSATVLSVRDAYAAHAGWDPWTAWDRDRFDIDMATKVEPALKEMGGGVFLMDYPPQVASLAKISANADSRANAERWEFYFDGIELANCFTELCDKDEQMRRFKDAKEARKVLKEADYPIDYEFIECLSKIRQAAGVALGIDRLVMALTKSKEISAVRAYL